MTGASGKDVEPRSVKMGLIEQVKNLRAELHIDLLGCLEVLMSRKIDINKIGARHGVSSQVPIGSWRRSRECTRIEPQVRSSQLLSRGYARATFRNARRGIVAESGVQIGTVRRPSVPVFGIVRAVTAGKRFPRTERPNSIKCPAAQNRSQGFPLEADGQGKGDRGDKIVSRVEGGTPPVAARVKEIHHRVGFLA